MSKLETKQRPRLGTQMRAALAERFNSPKSAQAHQWYFYSGKMGKDYIVPSDLQFVHVLLSESDPRIRSISYSPPPRYASEAEFMPGTIFDAEVILQDGSIELHEVKSVADLANSSDTRAVKQLAIQREIQVLEQAKGRQCRHVLFTENELFANPTRLRNWVQALAWIAQARNYSLLEANNQVALLIHAEQQVTLSRVLAEGGPLYLAAAFLGVANGRFASDLNELPMTASSRILDRQSRHR